MIQNNYSKILLKIKLVISDKTELCRKIKLIRTLNYYINLIQNKYSKILLKIKLVIAEKNELRRKITLILTLTQLPTSTFKLI